MQNAMIIIIMGGLHVLGVVSMKTSVFTGVTPCNRSLLTFPRSAFSSSPPYSLIDRYIRKNKLPPSLPCSLVEVLDVSEESITSMYAM
jgi:hypothetical protein